MNSLDTIIVTDISQPTVVFSEQGKTLHMSNRKSFGLSFCISGQITYELDGKRYVSDPGHAVILPKGKSYTVYRDKTGMFPLINFQCSNFSCDTFLVLPLQNPQVCIKDYETIRDLFLFSQSRLRIYSVFYGLLNQLSGKPLPQQSILYPAVRYLEENLSDPSLSNARLAAQAGVSEVYFRKLFAAQYGITPRQYILDIRMRKAMQLLADTTATVANIAEECGFSSIYHFCRAFKQRTGTTPTQFAQQNRMHKL